MEWHVNARISDASSYHEWIIDVFSCVTQHRQKKMRGLHSICSSGTTTNNWNYLLWMSCCNSRVLKVCADFIACWWLSMKLTNISLLTINFDLRFGGKKTILQRRFKIPFYPSIHSKLYQFIWDPVQFRAWCWMLIAINQPKMGLTFGC